MVKDLPANAGDTKEAGLSPGLGRSPGGRNDNPLQYLPAKSHRQRSLAGYSSWGRKESGMTEPASNRQIRNYLIMRFMMLISGMYWGKM